MFPNQGNRFLGPQGRPPFNPSQKFCQLCDKARHTARVCRSRLPSYFTPQENFMAPEPQIHNANWVIDSGASHHITSDLQNLSIHSEYGGTDDVIIGDGNGISITHTDSTNLITENSNFMLGNVLCAPSIHMNLIFVSQFCKHNCTSIEFFPTYFLVKDLSMGATLVQGQSKGNLYEWPTSSPNSSSIPQAYNTTTSPTSRSSQSAYSPTCHLKSFTFSVQVVSRLL